MDGMNLVILTSPIPSPSVVKNVNMIWAVKANHFIKRPSLLQVTKYLRFVLRLKTAPRVSQLLINTRKVCVSGSCCINVWYSFEGVSNTGVRPQVKELVARVLVDKVIATRSSPIVGGK